MLDFYARPWQEQVQALLAQDAEAQIRTVACGCEAARPGLRALEIPLARERGASALPVLSQTLRAAATACERTVSLNLVYLTLLDPQVSPGARRELLTLLAENWDAMPADWSRAQVLQWLREGGIPAPGAPGAPDAPLPAP